MFSISRDAAPSPSSWNPCRWQWISLDGRLREPDARNRWWTTRSWLRATSGRAPARSARGLPPGWRRSTRSSTGASRGASSRSWWARAPPGARGCFSSTLAGATARGGWAALVDGTDGLDPAAASMVGVPLGRLLWIRCGGRLSAAWRAADILVQSGGFELVAIDLGELPPWALGRTPPGGVRAPAARGRAGGDRAPHRRPSPRGGEPRRRRGGARPADRPLGVRWPGIARGARDRGAADPIAHPRAWRRRPAGVDRARGGWAVARRAGAAHAGRGARRTRMTAASLAPPRYACVWAPGFAAAALVRQDPTLRGRPVAALQGATHPDGHRGHRRKRRRAGRARA